MRKILPAILIFLLIGPVPGATQRLMVDSLAQSAAARPLMFAPDTRPACSGDQLRFVRGWHLVSKNSRFGGFSSLAIFGRHRFQLVADNGRWTRLTLDPQGRVSNVMIRRLPAPVDIGPAKHSRDAEAMTYDAVTGKSWVAFEGIDQIWRLEPNMTHIESRRHLPPFAHWPSNGGSESLVRLAGGRALVMSEAAQNDPRGTEALLFDGDPADPASQAVPFYYNAGGKGLVSDAALLPDGRVLLVHRRLGLWPMFTTILAVADPAEITAGGVWKSQEIGRVPEPLRENYEGAAVSVENSRTYVWLVSDHNFNYWQRSLLLKFELRALADSKKGGSVHGPP